jgi:hypothetical protein
MILYFREKIDSSPVCAPMKIDLETGKFTPCTRYAANNPNYPPPSSVPVGQEELGDAVDWTVRTADYWLENLQNKSGNICAKINKGK